MFVVPASAGLAGSTLTGGLSRGHQPGNQPEKGYTMTASQALVVT